jgi:hypothetical protein
MNSSTVSCAEFSEKNAEFRQLSALNSAVLKNCQGFLIPVGHWLKFSGFFNPTPEYNCLPTNNFKIGGAVGAVFHAAG